MFVNDSHFNHLLRLPIDVWVGVLLIRRMTTSPHHHDHDDAMDPETMIRYLRKQPRRLLVLVKNGVWAPGAHKCWDRWRPLPRTVEFGKNV